MKIFSISNSDFTFSLEDKVIRDGDIIIKLPGFSSLALSYKYIVEQQPIGRELFRQFCETQPEYKKSTDFLDAVVSMYSGSSYLALNTLALMLYSSSHFRKPENVKGRKW